MTCPGCGEPSPAEARFCMHCGAPLAGPVARTPRDYTPRHLVRRVLRDRAALEGERKQVTVLFADVQGSTQIAGRVDPEVWHRILSELLEILAEGVHRFEGTVNQYTGDGIMALFGAPVAHEDHAVRACHAALALRDRVARFEEEVRLERGLDFQVRYGLSSGEVVVGRIGDDLRMDYTAHGLTTHLAARLQHVAGAGQICLSEETARLAAPYFVTRDLGRTRVKGVTEPIRVYALEGAGRVVSRFDASRSRGLARFFGREREMAQLEAWFEESVASDRPLHVAVVGDAGVGKSRLCFEFSERRRADGAFVNVGGCSPYTRHVPNALQRSILRHWLSLDDASGEEEARRIVAGFAARAAPDVAPDLPLVFELLGIDDPGEPPPVLPPDVRLARLADVVLRLQAAASRDEPRRLLLREDLHWIDSASEATHAALEDRAGRGGMTLVNFRPDYVSPLAGRPWYREIRLEPLHGELLDDLVRHHLGPAGSNAALASRIAARAAGNPFFAEEIVRSLAEAGTLEGVRGDYRVRHDVGEIAMPANVQAALAARIDRLSERPKHVLRTAAVLGDRFRAPALALLSGVEGPALDRALEALTEARFLVRDEEDPDAPWRFAHPLILETAYGGQLAESRARLHRAAARVLAGDERMRRPEREALLAHHYEHGGVAGEAAHWHARVAARAAITDIPSALRHWRKVLELSDAGVSGGEGDRQRTLRLQAAWSVLDLGGRSGLPLEEARSLFEEGRAHAEHLADDGSLARLHVAFAARLGWSGNAVEQRRHLAEAARIAERSGDVHVQLFARHRSCVAEFHHGDFARVLDETARAVALAEATPAFLASEEGAFLAESLSLTRVNALLQLGRIEEAETRLRALEPSSEESHYAKRNVHVRALMRANLLWLRGAAEAALEDATRFAALAAETGSRLGALLAATWLGRAQLLAGRAEEARETFENLARRARAESLGLEGEASHLASLAEARSACRDHHGARRTAEEAIAIGRRRETRHWEAWAHVAAARVSLHPEARDLARAAEALDRLAERIDATGGESLRPFWHELRARLLDATGDPAASRARADAIAAWRRLGAEPRAARLADGT